MREAHTRHNSKLQGEAMNSTINYLDEQITERKEELWEKQGETLAVQYPELLEPISEISDLLLIRDRLLRKQLL